jgi:hypothetical protein
VIFLEKTLARFAKQIKKRLQSFLNKKHQEKTPKDFWQQKIKVSRKMAY